MGALDWVVLVITILGGTAATLALGYWAWRIVEEESREGATRSVATLMRKATKRIGNDDRMPAGHIGYPPGAVTDEAGNVQLPGCVSSPLDAVKLEPQASFPPTVRSKKRSE